jgi:hypothetical protein
MATALVIWLRRDTTRHADASTCDVVGLARAFATHGGRWRAHGSSPANGGSIRIEMRARQGIRVPVREGRAKMASKRWIRSGLVVSACVVGALAGASDVRAAGAGRITLTAADFHPTSDTQAYTNPGNFLHGTGGYVASLDLPPGATVTQVRLFAADDDAGHDVTLDLYRDKPSAAKEVLMATVESTGARSRVRTFETSVIASNPVEDVHRAYLFATMTPGTTAINVYGAEVSYTAP